MTAYLTRSTALLALTLCLGAPAFAQDADFDVEASNPDVAETLEQKEDELDTFFEQSEADEVDPDAATIEADIDIRAERELLERANREATEFNDIDDDDLAEFSEPTDATPRVDKPAFPEKDLPLDCPVGTTPGTDGTCLAGPDWEFED